MDKIDRAILETLEADGRESFGAIAERVSLSKTPCWTRVQNLERMGAIKGYRGATRRLVARRALPPTRCAAVGDYDLLKRIKDNGPITRTAAILNRCTPRP